VGRPKKGREREIKMRVFNLEATGQRGEIL